MSSEPCPSKLVALLVFDGIQILDVTGPAAVFAAANDAIGRSFYDVRILSTEGGAVQSNSAPALMSQALATVQPASVDTVLISGGDDTVVAFVADSRVAAWIRAASQNCRRLGSVCTGAFGLAHLGLLDGKRVATHWSACADLALNYPAVQVDAESLYLNEGQLWSSAGVSTGIDMALAMVSEDLGEDVTHRIAQRLVLYAKRPGNQAQFSQVLVAQGRAGSGFGELIEWMRQHLDLSLDVNQLAERASMSPRNFHRKFSLAMGETPAHFVEGLRMELAQQLLRAGRPVKAVAAQCAYRSVGMFSRTFERRMGLAPAVYLALHCSGPPTSVHFQ